MRLLLIKYTSVITFPWGLLPSVLETTFTGGNSPPPPSPYLPGKVPTFYLLPELALLCC